MLSYPEYTTQYSLSKGGFPSKVLHRLSGWAPLRRAIHPSSNSTTSHTHSISTLSLSLSLFPGANSIGFACHTFTPIPKHLRRPTHRISTLFFLLIRKPFRVLKNLSNIVVAGLGHIVFARCEGFGRIRKTKRWLRNKPIAKANGWGGGWWGVIALCGRDGERETTPSMCFYDRQTNVSRVSCLYLEPAYYTSGMGFVYSKNKCILSGISVALYLVLLLGVPQRYTADTYLI